MADRTSRELVEPQRPGREAPRLAEPPGPGNACLGRRWAAAARGLRLDLLERSVRRGAADRATDRDGDCLHRAAPTILFDNSRRRASALFWAAKHKNDIQFRPSQGTRSPPLSVNPIVVFFVGPTFFDFFWSAD